MIRYACLRPHMVHPSSSWFRCARLISTTHHTQKGTGDKEDNEHFCRDDGFRKTSSLVVLILQEKLTLSR